VITSPESPLLQLVWAGHALVMNDFLFPLVTRDFAVTGSDRLRDPVFAGSHHCVARMLRVFDLLLFSVSADAIGQAGYPLPGASNFSATGVAYDIVPFKGAFTCSVWCDDLEVIAAPLLDHASDFVFPFP